MDVIGMLAMKLLAETKGKYGQWRLRVVRGG